jgi:hypothetical protein
MKLEKIFTDCGDLVVKLHGEFDALGSAGIRPELRGNCSSYCGSTRPSRWTLEALAERQWRQSHARPDPCRGSNLSDWLHKLG